MIVNDDWVLDYVTSHINVSIVATCISSWHALAIQSLIYRELAKDCDFHALILICTDQDNYYIDDSAFTKKVRSCCTIVYYRNESHVKRGDSIRLLLQGRRSQISNRKRIIKIVSCSFPDIHISSLLFNNANTSIATIIVDEGVGSYTLNDRNIIRWIMLKHSDTDGIKEKIIRFLRETFYYLVFCKYIMSWPKCGYELMLNNTNGTLKKNETVIKSFQSVLYDSAKTFNSKHEKYKKSIVLITQPFVEDGMINTETYFAFMTEVRDVLMRGKKNIVLRIHPREKMEKYKEFVNSGKGRIIIDDCRQPFETILSECNIEEKPCAVIAINSTALVMAQLLFSIESYSIGKIYADYSNSINEICKDNVKMFLKRFHNVITTISDINELKKI